VTNKGVAMDFEKEARELFALRHVHSVTGVERAISVSLRRAYAAGQENMREWQPIDTAEKRLEWEILVWDGKSMKIAYWDFGFWACESNSDEPIFVEPTHWMPLPKSPALPIQEPKVKEDAT
jgi:hypothetical protein